MKKIVMTIKSVIVCVCFLIMIISCNSQSNYHKDSFLYTNAFPKKSFSRVALFALDSINKETFDSLRKSKVFIYVGSWGNSFVDSLGKPQTSLYKDYILNAKEVAQLEAFLIQQPCKSDLVMESSCSPTYKNVFVFYDADNHSIAQLHICFKCQRTQFNPDEEYMCDFENKVNFKNFEAFVNSIKTRN